MKLNYVFKKSNFFHMAWLICILFPFIQQRTYGELPGIIGTFYKYTALLSALFVYAFSVFNYRYLKGKKYLIIFALYFLANIVTTFLKCPAGLAGVLNHAIVHMAIILFISLEAERDITSLLKALAIIYGGFIYLNFITDIIFPQGLYNTGSYHTGHLLGDDNALIYVMLPGLICLLCYCIHKYNKIKWYAYGAALICTITLLRAWAVSAMLCMILFVAVILIALITKKYIKVPIFLGGVLGASFICFFGLANVTVQNFIVNVLKKDITLSGRTILWSKAIKLINESPFLGHGGYWRFGEFRIGTASRIYPCHTPYLQILIDGGILLFSLFLIFILLSYFYASKRPKCLSCYILITGLTFMLINYISEYSQFYHLFIIVTLILNSDKLNNGNPLLNSAKLSKIIRNLKIPISGVKIKKQEGTNEYK